MSYIRLCTYTLYMWEPVSEKFPLETNIFHESLTSLFSSSEIVVSAILFDVQPIVFSAVKNKSPFMCTNSPMLDCLITENVILSNVSGVLFLFANSTEFIGYILMK